jgi:phage tail sheath protein FI
MHTANFIGTTMVNRNRLSKSFTSRPRNGKNVTSASNSTHHIEGVNTTIAAFIGLARKGPTNKPIKISNFVEFERIFGAIVKEYFMGYCVQHFFINGGTVCYIIRVKSPDGSDNVPDVTVTGKGSNSKFDGPGIRSLDSIDLFNILCIPPYNRKNSVSKTVYRKALRYCEKRRAILIVDPPSNWLKNKAIPSVDEIENEVGNLRHPNAVMYYPHISAHDPLDNENMRSFVPSGAVAGIIARTDKDLGVWKAPAGSSADMAGVSELGMILTDVQSDQLNKLGINCLRKSLKEIVIWGARTLRGSDILSSEWKYLPVRRTALFIEESLFRGTSWAVFEPNDEALWSKIRLSTNAFMDDLLRRGAFASTVPSKAYFVKCDSETTTQSDIQKGIINIIVGFAPIKPAEFVVIKIQQITQLESNNSKKLSL